MKSVCCIVFAMVLIPVLAFGATFLEEKFEKTLPMEDAIGLSLRNLNGNVRVLPWEKSDIRIEALKKVKAPEREEAEKLLKEIRVEISRKGKRIVIRTEYPKWVRGKDYGMTVFYEIRVPEEFDLDLELTNGDVEVRGIRGKVLSRTTNGDVNVTEVKGEVIVRSTNGGVSFERIFGPADAEVVNGRIVMEVGEGLTEADLDVTNGNIFLDLPEEFSTDIEATTTNGSVHTDVPITVLGTFSKGELRGKVGGGGPSLRSKVVNGDIHIRKR